MDAFTYPLVESFHSVQGEGTWMGTSAFFLRLGGCDVHCPWCDTKESWSATKHPQVSVGKMVTQIQLAKPAIVIITGGEPLMHNLLPLTRGIKEKVGIPIHLETSGAHPLSAEFNWIALSPKTFRPPHPEIYTQAHELKVVVKDAGDLDWALAQAKLVPAQIPKYLQPEWHSPDAPSLVFDFILAHPDWRLSLQTHKLLGVR
ncbi:MAG: 7-carboxy-7-deazaguanine synthase QueE [Pseudanabaenaceae cyanobacterium bins.68]|nr:7-carboxy-7-deazaguanine synthase QueE [Pseudanabaenaceae cyanobacterium bins.68]